MVIVATAQKVSLSPGIAEFIQMPETKISITQFDSSSFFPNILQPAISILVNPIHRFFLKIGIIRPHVPLSNSSSTSLTSVVTMPGIDVHDMERRRQIALKALSERLARTTDANRQNVLPKSFPHHHQHQHGGHHAHHGHSHQHHGQLMNIDSVGGQPAFIASKTAPMSFTIPAIPLPPPPSVPDTQVNANASTSS